MKLLVALIVVAVGTALIAIGRTTGKEYPFGFGWFAVAHTRKTSSLVVVLSLLSVVALASVIYYALAFP